MHERALGRRAHYDLRDLTAGAWIGPRQLNDAERFAELELPKHPDGRPYRLYGYYHFGLRHIFVRNDVLLGRQPSRVFARSLRTSSSTR